MRNSLEKLVFTAVLAACGPKNGEPTTEITNTRREMGANAMQTIEAPSQFSELKNLYSQLKNASELKHMAAGANSPKKIKFKTATSDTIELIITSNGRQIAIKTGVSLLYLDLADTTPFIGDCIQKNDSQYCKTDAQSSDGTIARGLEAAFKSTPDTEKIFSAFGISPKACPEDRARTILTELLSHI